MTEASTTRRRSTPRTRSSGSVTVSGVDAHGAGAAGMMRRDRGPADEGIDLGVGLDRVAGRGLDAAIRRPSAADRRPRARA